MKIFRRLLRLLKSRPKEAEPTSLADYPCCQGCEIPSSGPDRPKLVLRGGALVRES